MYLFAKGDTFTAAWMVFFVTANLTRSVVAFGASSCQHGIRHVYPSTSTSGARASIATVQRSSPLLHTRLWASQPTAASSAKKYSQATSVRLQGLNAQDELAKLATKMNTPKTGLRTILTERLVDIDRSTESGNEKAEYIDWLLEATSTGDADAQTPSLTNPTQKNKKPTPRASGGEDQTFATQVKFEERPDLHPQSKRAIKEIMELTSMTEIQAKTFGVASSGQDVLGRARTGTGKTVAFLLPAIERVLQLGTHQNFDQVSILVVSPTRELATQIADQAEKLTRFHRDMSVQVIFGGTNMKRDISRMTHRLPTILVATPGRLIDHMQSTRIGGRQFGNDIMSQTQLVVLDETDRLLDMGFRKEIQKILGFLPPSRQRQTLLFSATIPPELKTIMAQNMKPDYVEVDCINDGDAATHTNAQVQQSHVIIPADSDRHVSSVVEVVRMAVEKYDSDENPAKVVVFFPTARLVNFFAELFNQGNVLSIPVLELHSKKSQGYRNRVSDEFRKMKRGVLFTSDVSARGVDYPNVSHVIQFGMPESRDQYIHRLGRTGRAGTDGKGWLVLSQWESLFLLELKGVDIPVDEELRNLMANPISSEADNLVKEVKRRVRGGDQVLSKSASGAYQAFLGYYLGQMKRMKMNRKETLVEIANSFAAQTGLFQPPSISAQVIGKMGLKGINGVRVQKAVAGGGGNGRPNTNHGHSDGRRAPRSNSGKRR